MSNRSFIYLFFVTIFLFIAAFISFLLQPRYQTSIQKGEIIFQDIKNQINDIKEIGIDTGIKKISIIKDKDDWYMKSKSSYKVKSEIVRKNLIQISEMRYFEKKTNESILYSRLNLDYPNNIEGDSKFISVSIEGNEPKIEFVLGKKRIDGVYIKKINENQTWLTSGILEMSSIDTDWLETNIFNIDYKDVNKVSINHSKENESFSITKDKDNENLLIDGLNKEQLPKSDLIANFLGYFLTNLFFEDVAERKIVNDESYLTKIKFELFNKVKVSAEIFLESDSKWVNFNIEGDSSDKLYEENKVFVKNILDWSYKLPSTKYNVSDTKLEDLLVED